MSILDEIIESKDITIQQILNNLLDGNDNLDLKTHIFRPKQLATLSILNTHLENLKFTKSSKLIESFIDTYLRYMVSYKRMSRIEVIKALTNLTDDVEGISKSKQLTTNLK